MMIKTQFKINGIQTGNTQKFYMFLTIYYILSRLKVIFSSFVRLPTAMGWNLSGLAFTWLSADHLISIKLSSASFAISFESTRSAAGWLHATVCAKMTHCVEIIGI